jgi:thiol-disulfide isomerase/thioredoxin/protein-disulfide isomerase
MRKLNWIATVIAVLLSASGAYLSGSLFAHHFATGPAWLSSACGALDESGCDEVMNSRWSFFPPKPNSNDDLAVDPAALETTDSEHASASAAPPGWLHLRPVPVAMIGLCQFCFLGIWFLVVGRVSWRRRWLHWVPTLVAFAGCCGSLWLIAVMAKTIGAWCVVCLATHLINFLLLGIVLFSWPADESPQANERHPAYRLAFAGFALAIAVCIGIWHFSLAAMLHGENIAMRKAADILQDADAPATATDEPTHKIAVRPDDPAIPAKSENAAQLVVFTDFQCHSCSDFDSTLRKEYLPLFEGKLQVVYKHFPLCKDCNDQTPANMHPTACEAAYLAEAARLQGGSDAFFRIKELVSGHRKTGWSPEEIADLARKTRLDPEQLNSDFASEAVRQRVREDVALGRELGVRSTPTAFLDGKKVDQSVKKLPYFWKMAAAKATQARGSHAKAAATAVDDGKRQSATRYAKVVLKKYDTNEDGMLQREESAIMPSQYHEVDADRDGLISERELIAKFEQGLAVLANGGKPLPAQPQRTRRDPTKPTVHDPNKPMLSPRGTQLSNVIIGQELDIAGPTLDGGRTSLEDFAGKPRLIVFWASWCHFCKLEMPKLLELYERHHGDGLEIIGVSSDKTMEDAKKYIEEQQLPWPQIYLAVDEAKEEDEAKGDEAKEAAETDGTRNALVEQYNVNAIPAVFVIDAEGKVVDRHLRGDLIEVAVAKLLGKEPVLSPKKPSLTKPAVAVGQELEIVGPALDGSTVDLKNYEGKVVLAMFWASWCGYCKKEMPSVQAVYEKYHDQGFEILGVSGDKTRAALEDYLQEHELPWKQIYFEPEDGTRVSLTRKFGIRGFPTMYLIGPDGKVANTNVRGAKLEPAVQAMLKAKLAEQEATEVAGP